MEPSLVGILGILVLIIMLLFSLHVFVAMGIVGLIGFWIITKNFTATKALAMSTLYSVSSSYSFIVIPLFILLGIVIYQSGIAFSIYEAFYRWVSKLAAGLAIATTIAVAIFSAVSGSSLACTVTFSKVSVPEMINRGYKPGFAAGLVAAASTQDALIPPSGPLILYAILTEQSIGKCLMAGFLPGILSVCLYIALIVILLKVRPNWFGRSKSFSSKEKLESLKGAWQIPLLAVLILGAIYTGVTTVTEAAALGTFLALVLAFYQVGIKGVKLWECLRSTVTASTMIFAILIGAFMFSSFLSVSRIPNLLSEAIVMSGLSKGMILLFIILLYTVLGTFMSANAVLASTIPIIFPIIVSLGYDPIWFSVIAVKLGGIGTITPPVGVGVYAAKGAVGNLVKLDDIFKGASLFLIADYISLLLFILFPNIFFNY